MTSAYSRRNLNSNIPSSITPVAKQVFDRLRRTKHRYPDLPFSSLPFLPDPTSPITFLFLSIFLFTHRPLCYVAKRATVFIWTPVLIDPRYLLLYSNTYTAFSLTLRSSAADLTCYTCTHPSLVRSRPSGIATILSLA